jgi:hypothetical protein
LCAPRAVFAVVLLRFATFECTQHDLAQEGGARQRACARSSPRLRAARRALAGDCRPYLLPDSPARSRTNDRSRISPGGGLYQGDVVPGPRTDPDGFQPVHLVCAAAHSRRRTGSFAHQCPPCRSSRTRSCAWSPRDSGSAPGRMAVTMKVCRVSLHAPYLRLNLALPAHSVGRGGTRQLLAVCLSQVNGTKACRMVRGRRCLEVARRL